MVHTYTLHFDVLADSPETAWKQADRLAELAGSHSYSVTTQDWSNEVRPPRDAQEDVVPERTTEADFPGVRPMRCPVCLVESKQMRAQGVCPMCTAPEGARRRRKRDREVWR